MGLAHSPRIVTDGLVLALDASSPKNYNVGVSTNWVDKVGGNNGTLYGGTHHNDGPFVGAGYVEFDGNTDKLSCTPSNLTGQFTIEGWWYATAFTSASVFFGKWGYECLLRKNGSNIEWYSAGNLSGVTATYTFNTGQWYHLAVSRDSSNVHRVFINGVQVLSTTDSDSITMTDFCIGAQSTGSTTDDIWTGYISNFRIVNGTALYTSNFTVPTKSLTAVPNTTLLTCQGNTIADASSSALSITTGGDISLTKEPFTGAGAVEFDGTGDNLHISNASALSGFTGDFTIEFWFKGADQTGYAVFLETHTTSTQRWAIQAEANGTTNMIWVRNGSVIFTTSGIDAFDDAWHHHAVVRNGSAINYYIDGVSRGSESHSGTLSACTNLTIGEYSNGDYHINGYLSNVRIINGEALYTAAFTPPTRKLDPIENTVLLTCQGQNIKDASSSAHAITVNGDAKATIVSSSFEFDGSNQDYILSAANPTLNWGTGDFTVEMWVNVSSSTSFGTLFATEVNAQEQQNNTFTIAMDSLRRLGIIAYSSYLISNSAATQIPQNTWTHIVATRQGTTLTLYIDKSSVATVTNSTNFVAGGYAIGTLPRSPSNTNFTGKVSNVRVYKGKALTLAEIEQNYNANKGRYE